MALIRKDKTESELKKICLEQLEVFLVNETNAFVDKLFVALNDKSYLKNSNDNSNNNNNNINNSNQQIEQQQPLQSNPPNEQNPQNPPNQQNPQNQQNQLNQQRSPKLHRNVPAPSGSSRRYQNQIPINTTSQVPNKYEKHSRNSPNRYSPSRHSPKKRRSRSRSLGKSYKRNRSRSPASSLQQINHNQNLQMQDRHFTANSNNNPRRCRDYDEKGYCMRGSLCSFNHGENAMVFSSSNASSVIGLTNSQTNSNLNSTLLPTSNQNQSKKQKFPEPYNPEEPEIDRQDYHSNDKRNGLANIYLSSEFNKNNSTNNQRPFDNDDKFDNKFNKKANNQSHQNRQTNSRPPFRPNNKRNNKPYPNNTTDNSEKTTLMVSKIPVNLNTITNLNEHFSKFGTITNLKIHYDNDPESSLVEFSTNAEALAAYRSTEAVLNNRFIKVFWHSSGANHATTAKDDKPNENNEADKSVEKKQSIRDRLGKIVEKQTSITNTAVTNLLNSGLIGNAPNQLASLMIGSSKMTNIKPSLPVSKPVFDPAKLKKVNTPPSTTTNSTLINSSTTNANTTTSSTSIATTAVTAVDSTTTTVSTTASTIVPKILNTTKINVSNKQQLNKEKLIKRLELQKKRQEMLSTLIQQNRLLVEKLEKSKSDAEKQSIRETVDSLTKQIEQLKADIKKGNSSIMEETNLQKQQQFILS